MDREGLGKLQQVLPWYFSVELKRPLKEDESVRFFSIVEGGSADPSFINRILDANGMMFHEGQLVTSKLESPLLKYLGSSGAYHSYEDVASD